MPLTDDDFERIQEPNMHSYDRTLLSKLGFADPDKRNPEHDQACLYLTQPDVARKVAAWMMELRGEWTDKFGLLRFSKVRFASSQEHHLQKGFGQYATTIGFIDVVYQFEGIVEGVQTSKYVEVPSSKFKGEFVNKLVPCEPVPRQLPPDHWKMFVEVKIAPVSIGDVLRQLNLYASYFVNKYEDRAGLQDQPVPIDKTLPRGLLVAPWDASAAELDALRKSGYEFLKLGKAFNDWKQSLSTKGDTKEI